MMTINEVFKKGRKQGGYFSNRSLVGWGIALRLVEHNGPPVDEMLFLAAGKNGSMAVRFILLGRMTLDTYPIGDVGSGMATITMRLNGWQELSVPISGWEFEL